MLGFKRSEECIGIDFTIMRFLFLCLILLWPFSSRWLQSLTSRELPSRKFDLVGQNKYSQKDELLLKFKYCY